MTSSGLGTAVGWPRYDGHFDFFLKLENTRYYHYDVIICFYFHAFSLIGGMAVKQERRQLHLKFWLACSGSCDVSYQMY